MRRFASPVSSTLTVPEYKCCDQRLSYAAWTAQRLTVHSCWIGNCFYLHWLELVAQPQQEGEIRLSKQQYGVVVNTVVKIQNRAVFLRFVFILVVIATVHKSPHNPLCVALLVLVVDNVGQRRSGYCCRPCVVGQLDIVVLVSKQQICSFGVDVDVVQRQRSSSICGGGGKSSKTATLQK